ncbi:MAG TPA: hypothetical protein VF225_10330, partial [Gaiellaceae bacterium]
MTAEEAIHRERRAAREAEQPGAPGDAATPRGERRRIQRGEGGAPTAFARRCSRSVGVAQERHELADLLDSVIAAGHVGEPHGWPPGAVAAGRRIKPPPAPCPGDIGSQNGKDGKGAQERDPWVAASLLSLFDASPGVREPVREI